MWILVMPNAMKILTAPPPRRCERHLYLMKNVLEFGKFLKN